jgi:hypothetical protein
VNPCLRNLIFRSTQIARLATHNRRIAEAKKQFQSPRKPLRYAA